MPSIMRRGALSLLLLLVAAVCSHVACASSVVHPSQLPLRTSGRWIVDQSGNRVKLACINWHGAQMSAFVPAGLTFKTPREIAATIRGLGFNCVRLNWSLELALHNPLLHPQSYTALRTAGIISHKFVRALEVFDLVVAALATEKVMVILDNHMSDGGWCCDPRDFNGLWFNERFSVAMFEQAWVNMVERYRDQLYVIGADLRNEIRPDVKLDTRFSWIFYPRVSMNVPTWGTGDGEMELKDFAPAIVNYTHPDLTDASHQALLFALREIVGRTKVKYFDWHSAAASVGNKIIATNANVLVIVGGLFDFDSYVPNVMQIVFYYMKFEPALHEALGKYFNIPDSVTAYSQLHNLSGVKQLPVQLEQPDRLVYTVHVYPFFYLGARFPWNETSPSYKVYAEQLDRYWGYIFQQQLAPVWIGETGNNHNATGLGPAWTEYTLRYLREHDLDFTYWPLADQRPELDPVTGEFSVGRDEYGMLTQNMSALVYPPLMQSIRDIFPAQLGPGVQPEVEEKDEPQSAAPSQPQYSSVKLVVQH